MQNNQNLSPIGSQWGFREVGNEASERWATAHTGTDNAGNYAVKYMHIDFLGDT